MADPAPSGDGLLALQARRASGRQKGGFRRTIPPSQNPTTLPPYQPPGPVVDDAKNAAPEPAAAPASQTPAEKSAPRRGVKKQAEPEAQVRLTVYVDESHDTFMDDVRFSGARKRPRIDVSRSAVVRFALDRLKAEMTPEQLYDAIAAKPVDPKATGRKRR